MKVKLNAVETLRALADGKKIRQSGWTDTWYIWLPNGKLQDDQGSPFAILDPSNDWELFEEPRLELTKEDVGRVVRLSNHNIFIITSYRYEYPIEYPFLIGGAYYDKNGRSTFSEAPVVVSFVSKRLEPI